MKEVKVSIHPVEIKSLKYNNAMTIKPGESMRLQMKTSTAVKLNPSVPTAALAMVKFEAVDETKNIQFEVETLTAVMAEPAVEKLDELIKAHYMGSILMAVNEKVRAAALMLGLTLAPPAIGFNYQDDNESIDAEIFRSM
ncbi:MAG: hypothetical protein K2J95_00525 [Lachnospiraceae bacterium]|nr:hypothetical protein [Lachnospiraceae bacterium]